MNEEAQSRGAEAPLRVLWRRRWTVLLTFVALTGLAALVSKSLDPVYQTRARLIVVQPSDTQSFDAVQAAQVTARTYSNILASANLASDVADRLGGAWTRSEVEDATSFETIPETQLLQITAEGSSSREAKRVADTYAAVFEQYASRRLQPTTKATVRVADAAPLPQSPARPKPTLYTLIAALFGLALGCALALLRDRLDTHIEDADELQRRFGLAALARVPRRGSSRESMTAFAEAFRMLRVAVAFADPGLPPRSVVVTSSVEGEGKTTTSRQLALAAAEAGQRVIAVEADVYRPALRRSLNLVDQPSSRRRGLTTYLLGQCDLEWIIEPTGAPGVSVIPAGPAPVSLASLLEGDRGRTLIEDLQEHADLILLDCPPVGPRADATVLAARSDATVLVVDLDRTGRPQIADALRALGGVRANVIGAVLNRDTAGWTSYDSYLPRDPEREAPPAPAVGSRGG